MPTKIEWCDETINPVVGCSKCSPGCDNCYAERTAARLAKNPNPKISGPYRRVLNENARWNGRTAFNPAAFDKLRRPGKSVFLCSMGDLFHQTVPQNYIDEIFNAMSLGPGFRFLVLTKRPAIMAERLADLGKRWKRVEDQWQRERLAGLEWPATFPVWPLPNVWLGVTVCNQLEADQNIPLLMLSAPAAHRFISIEPMLEPVDLRLSNLRLSIGVPNLDCVIVGGETGSSVWPAIRPMHPDWVRSIRDQCREAGVPFFFKGWGEWAPCGEDDWHGLGLSGRPCQLAVSPEGETCGGFLSEGLAKQCYDQGWRPVQRLGKKRSGRLLDGVEHNEKPW